MKVGLKCKATQSQEKYGHSSSFSALHPHQRFTLIPIFQSTKDKRCNALFPMVIQPLLDTLHQAR